MIKLKAIKPIDDQDGQFAVDDEFTVNDERAMVLIRTGKAERCADQSIVVEPTAPVEEATDEVTGGFRVPRPPVTE